MKVVMASNNAHKIAELRAILSAYGLDVVSQREAGVQVEPEETGTTFEENSRIKAVAVMQACGLPAVADDSGLMVDALNGEPGVYSARYGGPDCISDSDRIDYLLKKLGNVPEGKRIIFRKTGDGPVAQGPDQHDCQFLPGDGIAGTEIAGLTGNGPVLIAGPEGRLIPGALRHIRKDPVVGLTALPAEKTAECHGEARPGHGLAHAEGIGGLALKPSLSRAAVDGGCRPVVGRHILKGSRPGGNGKRPAQHRAQAQAGGQLFQNRSFHLSASL